MRTRASRSVDGPVAVDARRAVRLQGEHRVLPGAPVVGGPLAHRGVGVAPSDGRRPRPSVAVRGRASGARRRGTAPTPRGRTGRRRGRASRSPNAGCVVTPTMTISDTRSGCRSAYARISVDPHEPPNSSQRSMPRCSRSRSMSAIRWSVVLSPHVGGRVAGVRRAAPAAALVEQHDAVPGRVEVPARAGGGSTPTRAAVHDHARACRPGCRRPPSTRGCRRRRRACRGRRARSGGTARP